MKKDDIPQLKWNPADEEGIVKFLVEERNFNESRVRGVVKKINADRGKSNQGKPPYSLAIQSQKRRSWFIPHDLFDANDCDIETFKVTTQFFQINRLLSHW